MSLANHVRYLERRLAGLIPASIHRHQRVAYAEALEHARRAPSVPAYLAASQNLLELTRSEWLDRYETVARLYDSLGDDTRAEVARANLDSTMAATSHGELIAAMIAAKARSGARRQGAENAAAKLPLFLSTLLALRVEVDPAQRRERLEELQTIWRQMGAGDPLLTPARLGTHPPYRARLPFSAEGLDTLVGWVEELSLPAPNTSAPAPAAAEAAPAIDVELSGELPSVDDVAAGYRAAAAAIDPDDPGLEPVRACYRRIDELAAGCTDGQELLAAMADDDLPLRIARAPIVAGVEAARAAVDPAQVAAAAHYQRHLEELTSARSIAELELLQLAAEEHVLVESTWSHLFFSFALRSLAPIILFDATGSDAARAAVVASEELVTQLFGAGTEALLAVPAVERVFEHEVFERGQAISFDEPAPREVRFGEVAFDLVGRVQSAIVEWGISELSKPARRDQTLVDVVGAPRFATAAAMREHLVAVLKRAVGAAVAAASTNGATPGLWPLQMWGQPIKFDALEDALISPPRPLLPL